MILIADSSALIALSIVDKLETLEALFGQVYVPRAVYDEIRQPHKPESVKLERYCRDKVVDVSLDANFNVSLGAGESEAILLYQEKNADFLLCDDKKAKKFARSFGVNVVGSLGILLKAKESGMIDSIAPLLEKLRQSRIFIDANTYRIVLDMAGE